MREAGRPREVRLQSFFVCQAHSILQYLRRDVVGDMLRVPRQPPDLPPPRAQDSPTDRLPILSARQTLGTRGTELFAPAWVGSGGLRPFSRNRQGELPRTRRNCSAGCPRLMTAAHIEALRRRSRIIGWACRARHAKSPSYTARLSRELTRNNTTP
jgi:hypothetical protein